MIDQIVTGQVHDRARHIHPAGLASCAPHWHDVGGIGPGHERHGLVQQGNQVRREGRPLHRQRSKDPLAPVVRGLRVDEREDVAVLDARRCPDRAGHHRAAGLDDGRRVDWARRGRLVGRRKVVELPAKRAPTQPRAHDVDGRPGDIGDLHVHSRAESHLRVRRRVVGIRLERRHPLELQQHVVCRDTSTRDPVENGRKVRGPRRHSSTG